MSHPRAAGPVTSSHPEPPRAASSAAAGRGPVRTVTRRTTSRQDGRMPGRGDPQRFAPDGRPRARGLGIPLPGTPGPVNGVTDVPGVAVGYVTLVEGDGPLSIGTGPVRTGVTAILPRGTGGVGVPCAAGWYSLNGNGEMT